MNITRKTTLDEVLSQCSTGGLLTALIWQVKIASDLGVEAKTLDDMTFEEFASHVKRLGLDEDSEVKDATL